MAVSKSRVGPGVLFGYYCFSLAWLWFTWEFLWKLGEPDFGDRLLFGIFFLIGLTWLLATVYHTLEWFKFGDTRLEFMGRVFPGGKLTAVLRVPQPVVGTRTLKATLQCKHVYWGGTADTKSIREDVVWSLERDFPVLTRARKSECRIEFEVPGDAELTTATTGVGGGQNPGHYWELAIHADVPGIDLMRSFLVPVVAPPRVGT